MLRKDPEHRQRIIAWRGPANGVEGGEHRKRNLQHRHTESVPEVLLADDADTIRVPAVGVEVVTVTEDDEDPR